MQIAEKCIDLRSDSDTSTPTYQTVDRQAMAVSDFFPCGVVAPIILFRQPRTIQKLVGHALKGGKHYDNRSPQRFLKNDPSDIPDAIGCGKRRTTKLKNFHSPEPMYPRTSRGSWPATNFVGTRF
jgi:hypothetical protein